MDRDIRLKRLQFRSHHRGTREADLMVGGFFDRYGANLTDDEMAWFEALIEEQDVDIMAWAMGVVLPPARLAGPLMTAMLRLDYVTVVK